MNRLRPTLWRTCRAIANPHRLDLLRELFNSQSCSVTAIGKRAGLSEPHASAHLRALGSRGLITPHPKGKWVYYEATPNPNVEHAAEILDAIKHCCVHAGMTNQALVSIATSFSHERRITIAKELSKGEKTPPELSLATQVSPQALYRHLGKLRSRELVEQVNGKYRLAKPENPLAKTLLSIAVQ